MSKSKSKNSSAPAPKLSIDERAPEAQAAWTLFEQGNFRLARREAKQVIAAHPSEKATADARELITRTNLEPSVKITLLGMALVLTGIIIALSLR